MSSNFQDKLSKIKQTIITNTLKSNENTDNNKAENSCSNFCIKID